MDEKLLENVLVRIRDGDLSIGEAMKSFKDFSFEDIGYAKIDHHRSLRNGFAEVIYSENKTIEQLMGIIKSMSDKNSNILATRLSPEKYEMIRMSYPGSEYSATAKTMKIIKTPVIKSGLSAAVVTAGTADIGVAEEAVETIAINGYTVHKVYDAGVAGIHRLFANLDRIRGADVVITVAGMDGALASVIGGLVDAPVIAVPTSVGYGASFGGLAALLTMLNSCAGGVSVVNIDNGFGAGYMACTILKKIGEKSK
jgi:pyridinium-3,5-biscarboxylic acid mononucleotide synthase